MSSLQPNILGLALHAVDVEDDAARDQRREKDGDLGTRRH